MREPHGRIDLLRGGCSRFDFLRKCPDTSDLDVYCLRVSIISPTPNHEDWREKLQAWLQVCSRAETAKEQRDCLQFLTTHLLTAPPAVKSFVGNELDNERIQKLLLLDAFESAVSKILVDAAHSYMISRPMGGSAICTLVIPGSDNELTFEAGNEPMARAGAAAKAMIVLAGGKNEAAILAQNQVYH